jgi:hypothetical protein
MIDATPLTPKQALANRIINLILLEMETNGVTIHEAIEIMPDIPKMLVLRVQEEWGENTLIDTPIPPRTGQYEGEEPAMSA